MIGIYKIENLINHKVYIGQSIDIDRRFKEHKFFKANEKDNNLLHQDIKQYGIENFKFEILEECLKEELNSKEQYWIKYYNSYIGWENSAGYNKTIGGNGLSKANPTQIVQLWKEGHTIADIMQILQLSHNTVVKFLHNEQVAYIPLEERTTLYGYPKKVLQYTLNGELLNSFSSISEAVKYLKTLNYKASTSNIIQNCQRKITTAYNFIWKYNDDNTPIDVLVNKAKGKTHHRNRKVEQYDLQGNFIKIFNTVKEAQLACNLKSQSAITNAIKGRSKTAAGYIWKYHTESSKER